LVRQADDFGQEEKWVSCVGDEDPANHAYPGVVSFIGQ
jgi:hypothetical protein